MKFSHCGSFLDTAVPVLNASLDRITSCDFCSKTCLDIKRLHFSNHFLPLYPNSKLSYLKTNANRNNFNREITAITHTDAVAQRSYEIKMFLKISQNSQENTCAAVSFLIKLHNTSAACI